MKSAMLAILSGVSWGASAIVAKRLYARHPRVDLLSLTSWQMLYAALVMSVVALLVPQREIDWQPTVFWALAYSAILATALAWSLWLFVLKNLPASIASLSTLAVPVCGVLFSWWLLGENPGAVEGSGIVLIVLALALVSRKKKEAVSVKKDLNFFFMWGDLLFNKITIMPHHPPVKQHIFFLRACANVMYHQRRTVAGEAI